MSELTRIKQRLDALPEALIEIGDQRHAAIAIVLQGPDFLLTRRPRGLRRHGGQWALPGGRLDPGESPLEAAIREVDEEIGLRLTPQNCLGRLDDYPTQTGFVISPFVFDGGTAEPKPDPTEVASIHRFAMDVLARPEAVELAPAPRGDQSLVRIHLGYHRIHAPTGALLYQFREVCLKGKTTRVADLSEPDWAR